MVTLKTKSFKQHYISNQRKCSWPNKSSRGFNKM